MRVAIIGLPQSGKSTVFSAITGKLFDPFAPSEVRPAVVGVPDERLAFLTSLYHPKKVIEATIEFVDVPGCALDDQKGRDQWKRVAPSVRQADLLVIVVRDFENASVSMHKARLDAVADFDEMRSELLFSDLEAVTTRVERLEKSVKKPTKTQDVDKRELALLRRCQSVLESEEPLSSVIKSDEDRRLVSSFAFLTEKPIVCVRNVSDGAAGEAVPLEVDHVADSVVLSASIEAEIAMLDPEDRSAFLSDLGISAPARERLIQVCYQAAGLISFLTMGSDEVRAWPVRAGSTAVQAAGKIHTDLSRGFIRAETIAYADLVELGDEKSVKAAGKARKEGKGYIVQDGDIMNILSSA